MELFSISDLESSKDINKQIGIKLNEIILNNVSNTTNQIYEYDIGLFEDSSTILQIAENHYLLLNKTFMKSFYIYWRQNLLNQDLKENNIDLITLCVLLINPNLATAWSKRKSLHESNSTNLTRELELNKLILIKNLKCECAYVHRRWLIRKLTSLDDLLRKEVEFFFSSLCFKIKANYYCWSYLNWILFYALENSMHNQVELGKIFSWFFTKLEEYLYLNPSDYCLFHTRLNLITRLNEHKKLLYLNEFKKLVENELELIDDLTIRYSHLSSIWNYRKYLVLYLINMKCSKVFYLDWNDLNNKLNEKIEENKLGNKIELDLSETVWVKLLFKRELAILNVLNEKSEYCSNSIKFLNKFVRFYFIFFNIS